MEDKKIIFSPGDMEGMRSHARSQYDRLLNIDGKYGDYQVDSDVVDGFVEKCVPLEIRKDIVGDLGKAIWGVHPIIASERISEAMLVHIIQRLDAIVEWAEDGNEFDFWCEYDETTGKIQMETESDFQS